MARTTDLAVARWAKRLRVPLGKSVDGIFDFGESLIQCKADVGHGSYLEVLGEVGVEPRVAQMYTKVATNAVLSNAKFFSHLPPLYSALYVLTRLDDKTLERVLSKGMVTPSSTTKQISDLVARETATVRNTRVKASESELVTLHHGDLRDVLPTLPDESVAVFLCDPPYAIQYDWMYSIIGEHAARVLVPGGSLVSFCGHHQVPKVLNDLSEHLRYNWFCGMGHRNALQPMHGARVQVGWTPVVWFTKGSPRNVGGYPMDFRDGRQRDKRYHEWGKPEDWYAHWVERLTVPGEQICDPTSGGGTALVAAVQLGRRAIGIEIDKTAVKTARRRLASIQEPAAVA